MNNNSAKIQRSPELDNEHVQTEDDTLLPSNISANDNLEQDYPSDPNETDQVSEDL